MIDPSTAEVTWMYAQVLDPYGVYPNVPEEYDCVGRSYFARRPGSNIWVEFGDLPETTRTRLCKRNKSAGVTSDYQIERIRWRLTLESLC